MTESLPDLPAGQQEVHDELQTSKNETSNVNEETTDPTSDINKSEIKAMEVHHHPHVEKKNFKEYFLEFLMIFLAVTMGFIAENIREDITDHQKETELIQSLVKDLQDDSSTIEVQLKVSKERSLYSDSLIELIHEGNVLYKTADFYYYGRMTARWYSFSNNSRSIDEMKNGGLFRVIRNNEVAASIMAYYAFIPQIKNFEDRQVIVDNEYRKIAVQIFDPYIFNHMLNAADSIDRITGNPPLLKADKEILNDLAGWANYTIANRSAIDKSKQQLLDKGKELIALIRKEYHLKNE
jgi:hypothetical protein